MAGSAASCIHINLGDKVMTKPLELKPGIEANQEQDYEQVFQKYLEICNQAIEQNKNKFPYTEIWGARFNSLEKEAMLRAIIYDDRPKAAFMLRLTKDMKIEIAEKKPLPPEEEWPFTYQYLKRVVDNPKDYIDNPANLEGGGLKAALGEINPQNK